MRIFALNKRLINIALGGQEISHAVVPKRTAVDERFVLAYLLHLCLNGIHLAEKIAVFELRIRLIMYWACGVYFKNGFAHIGKGRTVA